MPRAAGTRSMVESYLGDATCNRDQRRELKSRLCSWSLSKIDALDQVLKPSEKRIHIPTSHVHSAQRKRVEFRLYANRVPRTENSARAGMVPAHKSTPC